MSAASSPRPSSGRGPAPEPRTAAFVPPLDIARRVARKFLAEADAIDVGTATTVRVYASHGALIVALRQVLDALDAEDGGQP